MNLTTYLNKKNSIKILSNINFVDQDRWIELLSMENHGLSMPVFTVIEYNKVTSVTT